MEEIIPLAISGIEALITNYPAISAEFQTLFAAGVPTAADFAALRAKVASQSYANLVPASQLPPDANDAAVALLNATVAATTPAPVVPAVVLAPVTDQAPAPQAPTPTAPAPTVAAAVAQETIHVWQ